MRREPTGATDATRPSLLRRLVPAGKRAASIRRTVTILAVGAAIAFIGFEIHSRSRALAGYFSDGSAYVRLAVCGICYGLGVGLVGFAWRDLVHGWVGPRGPRLSVREAMWVFSISNLLKYLPSNVFHVVGRYAALRHRSFPRQAVTWSLLAEMLLMSALAGALSLVLVHLVIDEFASRISDRRLALLGGVLVAVLLVALAASALRRRLASVRPADGGQLLRSTLRAVPCYLIFFLLNALLVELLMGGWGLDESGRFPGILGVVSAAWIIGLLTPGAPAGLGVREAVIMVGLDKLAYPGDPFVIALAYRFVTLIGECFLALASFFLRPRPSAARGDDRGPSTAGRAPSP